VSNSLAIAAVTATLRSLFVSVIPSDPELADTIVTTRHPDNARNGQTANQLNAFLYQTNPNAAWRNSDIASHVLPGESKPPALALDLSYLITAYGREDDDIAAHRVLGRAMGLLNDHAVLGRNEIQSALIGNDLHEQVERVRISPRALTVDEISKLWSAFQTEYRISAAYDISVVLIESDRPARAPLPVLVRGPADAGVAVQADVTPPFPTIEKIELPDAAPGAQLGDIVTVLGHHLDGDTVTGVFSSPRLPSDREISAQPGATATEVRLHIPQQPAQWVAGTYSLFLRIERAGQQDRTTNVVPIALAPRLTGTLPLTATRDPDGVATVTVDVRPNIRPPQRAQLILGDRAADARPRTAITGTLEFDVADAPVGEFFIRVRIDGIDSLLVDRSVSPPVFDPDQKVTIS
jgi:Pvc16 N-terminal domain